MKGYSANIDKLTKENTDYRRVLYTAEHSQLVIMSLKPGEEIGEEVHRLDQFIRCEVGFGRAVLDGVGHELVDGVSVVIPAGIKHNVINTSPDEDLKIYTLYSPPEHKDGTIHKTKSEAKGEHFDGKTTE